MLCLILFEPVVRQMDFFCSSVCNQIESPSDANTRVYIHTRTFIRSQNDSFKMAAIYIYMKLHPSHPAIISHQPPVVRANAYGRAPHIAAEKNTVLALRSNDARETPRERQKGSLYMFFERETNKNYNFKNQPTK